MIRRQKAKSVHNYPDKDMFWSYVCCFESTETKQKFALDYNVATVTATKDSMTHTSADLNLQCHLKPREDEIFSKICIISLRPGSMIHTSAGLNPYPANVKNMVSS